MNNKIIALIMAVAMAAVGLAVGLGNMTQADEAGQSVADPVWIIGDADTAYLVAAGGEIKIATIGTGDDANTIYPVIDFNLKAFDNPTLKISVAEATEIVDDEKDLDYTWVPVGGTGDATIYSGNVLDTASSIIADDADSAADGVYNVKLKAASGDNVTQDEDVYYYIKVDVTRNDPEEDVKFDSKTLSLYYAAHIMITDKTYSYSVVLSTSDEDYEDNADDAIGSTTIGTGDSAKTFQTLEFTKDVSTEGVYAMVKQTISDDTTYNIADYDFYAKGLPVGMAMKLNGEISGKVAASVSTSQDWEDFGVYAVDKTTGNGVYLGDFKYKVVPGDGFTYEVDEVTYSWADPAYMVVKNTEEIEVTISDIGVNVYITMDDKDPVLFTTTTEEGQKVTIGDLDDYTGILQIQLEQVAADSIHTGIIHVLVLGPVVHSGLLPTATSS